MKFILDIAIVNDAFSDEDTARSGSEVARILRQTAAQLEGKSLMVDDRAHLSDVNGNRVGLWFVDKYGH